MACVVILFHVLAAISSRIKNSTLSFQMPSVTLKDVDQHKFVKAFAAFLKKYVKDVKYNLISNLTSNWLHECCVNACSLYMYY